MTEQFKKELEKEILKSKHTWNSDYMIHKLNNAAIREIFAMKHEVNLIKDENGMAIPGTGRIITNEEKKSVLDYIIENDFPLTKNIYNVLLKGYIQGEIELETEEKRMKI